jgi:O-antigen/teichoic acid export membrane protein
MAMLKYGILGQGANIFQLVNYRLSYYLVDIFVGRASLGVFSAATQISEGLWILGKSIGTVQFARISNSSDREYARRISLKLFKITVLITAIPLFIFMVLPKEFYTILLGPEFEQVRSLIRWLSIGTISLTASMLLSHYFSGTGRIGKNTLASGIGVVITLILGFSLVPIYGVAGAAAVTSLSYFSSLMYLIIQFRKEGDIHLRDVLITKLEVKETLNLIFKRKTNDELNADAT